MYENDVKPWEAATVEIQRQLLPKDSSTLPAKSTVPISFETMSQFHKELKANIAATTHLYPLKSQLCRVRHTTKEPRHGLERLRRPKVLTHEGWFPTWPLFYDYEIDAAYAIVTVDDTARIACGQGSIDRPFDVINTKHYRSIIATASPTRSKPHLRDALLYYATHYGGILPKAY